MTLQFEVLVLAERGNRRPGEKPQNKVTTNDKLDPAMMLDIGFEPRPRCREVDTLTTAPVLLHKICPIPLTRCYFKQAPHTSQKAKQDWLREQNKQQRQAKYQHH